MNVFEYAMKMELDGKAFYEKLAAESGSEGLRKIFSELAADEQKHFDIFRKLGDNESVGEITDSRALEEAKNLFDEMQVGLPEKSLLKSNLDAYQYAMKVEEESVKLYREAAEKETDEGVQKLLRKISVEEQKHLHILENIFDFVDAPNHSLVWAEFSNLNEY